MFFRSNWLLIVFILSILFSYIIGSFFRDINLTKFKYQIVRKSIFIALLCLILALLPIYKTIFEQNLQQGLFTFSSVYFGFWLAEQARIFEERRRLRLNLGLLWQEHRFNKNRLEEIKKNYRFLPNNSSMTKEELLKLTTLRFNNIKLLITKLKRTVYEGFISSGGIVAINILHLPDVKYTDRLFNNLQISYSNLEYLESLTSTILLDFQTKLTLHAEIQLKFGSNNQLDNMINDMYSKVKIIAVEIAIAYRSTVKTMENIDDCLTKLNVKTDEKELREDILNKDDHTFINNTIRDIDLEEIKNPFFSIES